MNEWGWLTDAISWFLIGVFVTAPTLRIHASYILWQTYGVEKQLGLPTGATLERFIIASTGAVASLVLAVLGTVRAGWLLGFWTFEFPQPWTIIGLGVALFLLMIPAYIWEVMYRSGRLFR